MIQGERRTSNIDSKIYLLGFELFQILIPQPHFGDFFNAIGQKQPESDVRVESGVPRTADIGHVARMSQSGQELTHALQRKMALGRFIRCGF